MANYSNNNQINVPEAREAMRNMKHEVANELGITLNQGYNGNISAKDAGHIGGNMVKNMLPVRPRRKVRSTAPNAAQNRALPAQVKHRAKKRAAKYRLGNMLPKLLDMLISEQNAAAENCTYDTLIHAREHIMLCENRLIGKKLGMLEYRARVVV